MSEEQNHIDVAAETPIAPAAASAAVTPAAPQAEVPAAIKIKQPPLMFSETQKILTKLRETLGAPVITYWSNPRGAVCHSDVVGFFELLEGMGKQETIYMFIKSNGGNGQASLRIVNLIRQYCKKVVALIPLECASAATMISLGADEIQMGPMAYLTAVDTSLTHDLSPIDRDNDRVGVSLDELSRVVRLWRAETSGSETNPYEALFKHVHPLVIGAVDRADSLSIMLCKELLSYHIDDAEKAEDIAQTLNARYPSHSYPILRDEASRIGLKTSEMAQDVNALCLELNTLFSEMGQKATTDYSETRAHGNEILNILTADNQMIYYQQDKDWFYRSEERRWITMNDNSSWRKVERVKGRIKKSILHIA